MDAIDPVFLDKKFNASRYMLRHIVGAPTEQMREDQLRRIAKYRSIANQEIASVIDENYTNFNHSIVRFTEISNGLQEARETIQQLNSRMTDGKSILNSNTKNLRDLILHRYEANQVIEIIDHIQEIEASPTLIRQLLQDRKLLEAAKVFAKANELVFREKLIGLNAVTGIRNALMECKPIIEEYLINQLRQYIYIKDMHENQQLLSQFDSIFSDSQFISTKTSSPDIMFQNLRQLNRPNVYCWPLVENELQELMSAVQLLHRDVEVGGAIKDYLAADLNDLAKQVTLVCKSTAHFRNVRCLDAKQREITFMMHEESAVVRMYFRFLLSVLEQVVHHHIILAKLFDSVGSLWKYDMNSVIKEVGCLLERMFKKHFVGSLKRVEGSITPEDRSKLNFNDKLFQLSRPNNLSTPHSSDDDNSMLRMASNMLTICDGSIFHLPIVFADLEDCQVNIQTLAQTWKHVEIPTPIKLHENPYNLCVMFKHFIQHQWFPTLKTKALNYLNSSSSHGTQIRSVSKPPVLEMQPLSIEKLLVIIDQICKMSTLMPEHRENFVAVIEVAVFKWLDSCSLIARGIRETSTNEQTGGGRDASLINEFAQLNVCYQSKSRVTPVSLNPHKTEHQKNVGTMGSMHNYIPQHTLMKVHITEKCLYNPATWINDKKGLIFDPSILGMLAYISQCCTFLTEKLQSLHLYYEGSNLSKAASLCTTLGNDCLFFLRREIRLHCFFHLTQLANQKYDYPHDTDIPLSTIMAHDHVLSLNIDLARIEAGTQRYLSKSKMAVIFHGIDHLLSDILIQSITYMKDAHFTKRGVEQMLVNIRAAHQGLTGVWYSYPLLQCSGKAFEYARHFYRLLLLPIQQVEVFCKVNSTKYPTEVLNALLTVVKLRKEVLH